jgi:hypothetical protein
MITVLIITFKFIIIIMETSLSNTCSSSVMNTNTIIQKTNHKILKKNKRQKNLSLKLKAAEKSILEDPKTSQWLKSWIVFYRFCLNDPLVFALVK